MGEISRDRRLDLCGKKKKSEEGQRGVVSWFVEEIAALTEGGGRGGRGEKKKKE